MRMGYKGPFGKLHRRPEKGQITRGAESGKELWTRLGQRSRVTHRRDASASRKCGVRGAGGVPPSSPVSRCLRGAGGCCLPELLFILGA